jgi:hypothetical protein
MDHPDHPAAPGATGAVSLQEILHHLRGSEGELPAAIRSPLLAAGATVVPALITLVEGVLADDQTDWGWASLHAVELLGALGDVRAVPVLLRCLDQEDDLDLLVQQAPSRCAGSARSSSTAIPSRMPRRRGTLSTIAWLG